MTVSKSHFGRKDVYHRHALFADPVAGHSASPHCATTHRMNPGSPVTWAWAKNLVLQGEIGGIARHAVGGFGDEFHMNLFVEKC
jgi:hypothetical protein